MIPKLWDSSGLWPLFLACFLSFFELLIGFLLLF